MLTMGSWLCHFCSLDLQTLHNHCCMGHATLQSINSANISNISITLHATWHLLCTIKLACKRPVRATAWHTLHCSKAGGYKQIDKGVLI
jgi:hypothetical protein